MKINEKMKIKKFLFSEESKIMKTETVEEIKKNPEPPKKRQGKLQKYLSSIFSGRKKTFDQPVKAIPVLKLNVSDNSNGKVDEKSKLSAKIQYSKSFRKSEDSPIIEIAKGKPIYKFEMKYSVKTKAGKGSDQKTKVNQDNFFIKLNMCGDEGRSLFLVFDGHGPEGHKVSTYLKCELGGNIEN